MTERCNRALKHDFIDAFMSGYRSVGHKVPFEKTAYGKPYTVIETRANYIVIANGKKKRFASLYAAGNFIYDMNFDPKKIYIKPLSPFKASRLQANRNIVSSYSYAMAM